MSWYRITYIAVFAILLNTTLLPAKEFKGLSEDALIIQGLLFDEYRAYENSRQVFAKLYDITGAKEYLFREMTASLLGGKHITGSIARLEAWDKKNPGTIEATRLLIPLYLTNQQIPEAKKEAEDLLKRSKEPKDMDLASNPYLYSGEFERALDLLGKAYAKSHNEDVLLRMAVIMDEYTHEQKKAIQLLETHRRMNVVHSTQIYFKLLKLYIEENDIEGLLDTYKALYEHDDDPQYLQKIIEAYVYKLDFEGAIAFLEEKRVDEKTLYELYKRQHHFDKALKLAEKFYENDKNARWLAEKAIMLYEKSDNKNDKKMIANVIKNFDEAIAAGVDDSLYLNYYGYTLIDKDIDIEKGMKIIADALKQQPHNTYYLDSMAWGYYKTSECKKAYDMMKKVVDQEGLKEPEIAEHWEAIQKCQ